jgi:glycerophosphoryl diester phosphodiesterase
MGRTFTGYAYLDEEPDTVIAMAHRGGAAHPDLVGLENTRHAFEHAVKLGYVYLETDVHATSDGVLLAFHDASLDRVTDQKGELAGMAAADVARALVGGVHGIPTLEELLAAFPQCRFNIDLKADSAVRPLVDLLDRTGAHDRVCVGSFSRRRLRRFRELTGLRVATSAAPGQVALFLLLPAGVARFLTRGQVRCLQVPRRRGRLPIVTRRFVRKAHAAGAQVHVWTVDEPAEMEELADLGVDGLITDRTDLLKDVLTARGLWRDA